MRIGLIVLLVAALVGEIWAVFVIDHHVETTPSVRAQLLTSQQTGTVTIGDQLAERARTIAAEDKTPRGPVNPNLGPRIVRGYLFAGERPAAGVDFTLDQRPVSSGVNPEGYAGMPQWRDITDKNGYFEVCQLSQGEFVLRAWNESGLALAHVDLTGNRFVHELVLRLAPAGSAEGAIVRMDGAPMNDALVFAMPVATRPGDDNAVLAYLPTPTDVAGRFAFMHIPNACRFLINAPGQGLWVTDTVMPGTPGSRFQAESSARIGGTVLFAESEKAASGVVVSLEGVSLPIITRRVKSDSAGVFAFDKVPAGTYRLTIENDRLAGPDLPIEITVQPGSARNDIRVEVVRTKFARGRVTTGQGAGLAGLEVVASSGSARFSCKTDQAGYYRIGGLTTGSYDFAVLGAGGHRVTTDDAVRLDVQDALDTAGPDFIVNEGAGKGQVACVVKDTAGKPVEGAALYLYAAPATAEGVAPVESESAIVLTDAEGRYLWDGVPRDWRFNVHATRAGRISRPHGWAVLGDQESVSVELVLDVNSLGLISGVVVDELGRPLPDYAVTARAVQRIPGWPESFQSLTGSDGSFEFVGCPENEYRIAAGKGFSAEGAVIETVKTTQAALGANGVVTGLRLAVP